MSDEIPRLRTTPKNRIFELGKKIDPDAKSGLIKILKPPTAAGTKSLQEFVKSNGPRVALEIGAAVPLSILEHAGGVPFVILGEGRKSFDGLGALPSSVRRLSIRKHAKALPLGELPAANIEELELDAPSVKDGPALPRLKVLGWTRATDEALPFIEAQPALLDLGLSLPALTKLPASPSIERLLLFTPSKLVTLEGIEGMPQLRFLRIDQPRAMKRLGDLSALRALTTMVLIRAHGIADLGDLTTAPALETLNVSLSQLDAEPFKKLKGKLTGGSFQLKSPKLGMEVLTYLGVPPVQVDYVEPALFDVAP